MSTYVEQGFDVEPEAEHAAEARKLVEQAVAKVVAPKVLRCYRAVNIVELVQTPLKPRERILSPWLLTQSLSMLYAWRGVGKTHVALGIGFAVASGGAFLGWQATTPRRVLYLDGEMPGASLQSRLASLISSSDVDFDPDNFRIVTPDLQDGAMPDISTVQGQEEIFPLTKEADLIIVDNLSTLARSGGRENDAESWQVIAEWALMMRQEGRSVLFIHHSGKGGGQRGTSKKEDILDTVITLKRPPDYQADEGAKFEVHFEKGRDLHGTEAEPFEAALITDPHGNQSWAISKLAEATFDRVVSLANEGLSQAEICIELDIHKSNVSRHMRKARELGMLKGDAK
ncbi:AAA family ATPase [Herbaspirillum sp. ST 5-3]|uniref:AAA family ATPase n=1 Tax=Oxalobacteraceae TaxID=75682 RepID=UPI0010A4BA69|nr:AAA family ATPase [Herbaspirillum sp. ST 5-3]